ncbi:MAG: hypothetical protein ACTSRC_20045 [Candidatus Helarchaeota archaeon]
MIVLTDKAKEAIQEDLDFYLDMEEENLQQSDLGLILYVRNQKCSGMVEGGFLYVAVAIEPIKNYKNNHKFANLEFLADFQMLPVYIEDKAQKMLAGRSIIEIDSRGTYEKELLLRDAPIKDLGSCEVRFKRAS